jgi:hypothetical protein
MVGRQALMTDSPHVNANANKNKYEKQAENPRPKAHLEELEAAANEERIQNGKKN